MLNENIFEKEVKRKHDSSKGLKGYDKRIASLLFFGTIGWVK